MTNEYMEYLQNNSGQDYAKAYIHCDLPIKPLTFLKTRNIFTEDDLLNYLKSKHSFLPLIKFNQKYMKIKKGQNKRKHKSRDLFYASHRDRCIYMTYNFLLLKQYSNFLVDNKLEDVSLAYRKISKENNNGKSNIDFAFEVFSKIKSMGDCLVICEDISSFFDSLDHLKLKSNVASIVNQDETLKSISEIILDQLFNYRYIEKKSCRKIHTFIDERGRRCYVDPNNFRHDFKAKFGITKDIVKKSCGKGIPQGTSVSGTLANIYLMEFDKTMSSLIQSMNGIYHRYSDDLIVVVPLDEATNTTSIEKVIKNKIDSALDNIGLSRNIDKSKTVIFPLSNPNNFLQYLGFELRDKISFRNGTIIKYFSTSIKKYKRKQKMQLLAKKLKPKSSKKQNNKKRNIFSYVARSIGVANQHGISSSFGHQMNRVNRSKNKRLKSVKESSLAK
jgi:hypothetical protein